MQEILAVYVLSLFEYKKEVEDVTIYLIDNGIKEENMRQIQEIVASYCREIISLPMSKQESLTGMDVVVSEKSKGIVTYGCLLIVSLLSKDIDNILYFNFEIIFLKSIKLFWKIDIGESFARMMADAAGERCCTILWIPGEGVYYNSSVINLALWREHDIEKKFMEYLVSQGRYVPWPDQRVINAILDGKIKNLPCEYNVHTTLFMFSYDILLKAKKIAVVLYKGRSSTIDDSLESHISLER